MFINIQINLNQDDTWEPMSAEAIIAALGGDKDKDSCTLTVTGTSSPPPPEPLAGPAAPV